MRLRVRCSLMWMSRSGCAYRKPKMADGRRESVDNEWDGRSLQVDLVCDDWAVPVASGRTRRKHCLAASAQCTAAQITEAAGFQQCRSAGVCQSLCSGTQNPGCTENP